MKSPGRLFALLLLSCVLCFSQGGLVYPTSPSPCVAVGSVAGPSLVACGAASRGLVYCDVAASAGICRVSSTAVKTNSVIGVFPNTADGAALGKTCNAAPTIVPTQWLAVKVDGVSFDINMPTETVNGECFEFVIYPN